MNNKTYYKIKDNSCDEWEIIKTNTKGEDTFDTFRECKAELASIFKSIIEFEKEALNSLKKLKKKDIS